MVLNIADALSAYKNSSGSSTKASGGTIDTSGTETFGDMLKNFAGDAAGPLKKSEEMATTAAKGGKADLTSVVTAISNAELMLQTVVAIRDKVIAAYQDI